MKKPYVLVLLFIFGCSAGTDTNRKAEKEAVLKAWTGLWAAYEDLNFEGMLSYYEEGFIHINQAGKAVDGRSKLKGDWKAFETNKLKVLDRGQPTFIMGSDNIVTYNTYNELYIARDNSDTTHIKGTWIAVWNKQPNGDWKVRMATWQSRRINQLE